MARSGQEKFAPAVRNAGTGVRRLQSMSGSAGKSCLPVHRYPLLRLFNGTWYGFRLSLSFCGRVPSQCSYRDTDTHSVSSRTQQICLEHLFENVLFALAALLLTSLSAFGQTPAQVKAHLPPRDEIWYGAVTQESNSNLKHLVGAAYVKTSEMQISADSIDFDSDTDWAYAHGHVHMDHFVTGDKIDCDHAEYNLRTEEGKFYVVSGTSPSKILTSPGVLTTTNPFSFHSSWAERIKNRYILYDGFLTDCKMPKPWWTFQSPKFVVVPGDHAIARNAVFRLHNIPVFYLPWFYRPLGRNPRQSGFLTPDFGHSTLYGWIYGAGYYWAPSRSYDMTGIVQDLSARGPAFTYDFRGKPNENTDFNFRLYDVDDQGIPQTNGTNLKQGGLEYEVTANTKILGFDGHMDWNYLSSFTFRQEFSYTFATAVYNEVVSEGFLQRRFFDNNYTLNILAQRNQDYIAATPINEPQNEVIVQKLPELQSSSRDQQIVPGALPFWFSYNASIGALTREEPTGTENTGGSPIYCAGGSLEHPCTFSTGTMGRLDIAPHLFTVLKGAGFSFEPALTLEGTGYSNSFSSSGNTTTYGAIGPCGGTTATNGYPACPPTPTTYASLADESLFRKTAQFTLDIRLPTLERIYNPPKWAHLGDKIKHVLETEATYEYVTGVDDFNRTIHFDSLDILANTNQLTYAMTNRLYRKEKHGNASEFLTWRVAQARYFDPTFGGAAVEGQRSVIEETEEITPYTFLDGPRAYSPVVSTLTFSPLGGIGFEWRAEYDPFKGLFDEEAATGQSVCALENVSGTTACAAHQNGLIANAYTVSGRRGKYFAQVGETDISVDPLLFPQSNQISFGGGYGSATRKGWNIAGTELYDLLLHRNVFQFIQGTYNTDCCGFSVQYRRINFGIRDENQYLFSFSLANLGTFGSLQKQERLF